MNTNTGRTSQPTNAMTPEPTELKLCPFCGSKVRFVPSHVTCEGGAILHAEPQWCCVQFSCLTSEENEALVKEWNTRAPSELESLRAEVERLKEEVNVMEDKVADYSAITAELTRLRAENEKWKEWAEYACKRFIEETGKDLQAQSA